MGDYQLGSRPFLFFFNKIIFQVLFFIFLIYLIFFISIDICRHFIGDDMTFNEICQKF
jgi:hypothetical protein